MADTLTVTGVCTEISERSGWHTFHIDIGRQYPVKLATKKDEVIAAARAAGQELATWTYNEVESEKVNEHTGKPYVNRYLESVETGGAATPRPQAQVASNEPHRPAPSPADRDKAIIRQTCLKVASTLVAATGTSDGDVASETISLAARFETWVRRDVDDVPFE